MQQHADKISHCLNIINEILDQYPESDQDVDVDESVEEFLDIVSDARNALRDALEFIEE